MILSIIFTRLVWLGLLLTLLKLFASEKAKAGFNKCFCYILDVCLLGQCQQQNIEIYVAFSVFKKMNCLYQS